MDLKEIFVWGIRRSGNHMLVDFLLDNREYPGLTEIEESKKRQRQFRAKKILLNDYFKDHHYSKDIKKKSKGIMKGYPAPNKRIPPPIPETGTLQLISYELNPGIENQSYSKYINILEDPSKITIDTGRENVEKYGIMILRDPFNWAASLGQDKNRAKNIDNFINLWIEVAEKFFINTPNENYFPLKYNQFIKDKEYRRQLSEFLNEDFLDRSIHRVSSKGSSFNGNKYDGKAQHMDVENRWRNMPEWILYKVASNKKICELSEEIFDFNPFK